MEKFVLTSLFLLIIAAVIAPQKKKREVPIPPVEKAAIILGDKSGHKNAINISTHGNSIKVDTPLTKVNIQQGGKLSEPIIISKEELAKDFSGVIDAQPQKAFETNIFFTKGIALRDDYLIKIFQIKNEIKRRQPCEVEILGYSDTKGSNKHNLIVSEKRAQLIKKLLETTKVPIEHIHIHAYGEEENLQQTANNVSELQNRRVKVIIK